jgi:hypothetical protein
MNELRSSPAKLADAAGKAAIGESPMSPAAVPAVNRVGQLVIGIVCMALIANLQYGWTLFVNPIQKAHGWTTTEIQLAFSIFVALETWLTPVQGWIVDGLGARGPKLMVAFGGILVGLGWAVNSGFSTWRRRCPASGPEESMRPASAMR